MSLYTLFTTLAYNQTKRISKEMIGNWFYQATDYITQQVVNGICTIREVDGGMRAYFRAGKNRMETGILIPEMDGKYSAKMDDYMVGVSFYPGEEELICEMMEDKKSISLTMSRMRS